METTKKKKLSLLWLPGLVLPAVLTGLFYLLRTDRARMDAWVNGFMKPAEQFLGRIWAMFPFAVGEALAALAIAAVVLWVLRALLLLIRQRKPLVFLRRLLAAACVFLWVWCGICWCWNAGYYATGFSQKSGLSSRGHSPQELWYTTVWFAQNAARLSTQVQRDDEGHFSEDLDACFHRGKDIYRNIVKDFPFLDMESVRAKPLLFSRLQSILGFTGVYFPFTGEANVNVDAPACLVPATIAHEMAHQRMVASENEANFVGIAAAVKSEDAVFQYSGYLLGLVELSNALYKLSPELWEEMCLVYFTPELSQDWDDNYNYWKALDSSVEEAATQTYDSFLKGNGQSLGIASYGACVDLLISYFMPEVFADLFTIP